MRILVRSRRRSIINLAFAAALAGLIALVVYGPITGTKASANSVGSAVLPGGAEPAGDLVVLASPGRIEGLTDVVEVGAGIDGLIEAVHVKEGQRVTRGQLLAELDCRELRSSLPLAKSEADSLRQVRARLMRGSRPEERQAAAQRTAKAKTLVSHAATQLERQQQLAEAKTISRSSLDDARRDANVAESEYQLALRDEALINAGPLAEEAAKANADVETADRRVAMAEEKLGKCVINAPMNGTILRINLHPSESFALVSPRPILTMADISGRRVRAEVDERDVSKIHNGQIVIVSSDSFAGKRYQGKVTRVASIMGRKSVLTGDPADKNDRDVLEVIAQLEPAATTLPIGLRATVHFQP